MSTLDGIAILGAGIFAQEAHLPGLVTLGSAAPPLKAVYSRSQKSAQGFAEAAAAALGTPPSVYYDGDKSTDLDALLARPDISAVIVVLPITLQPSIILKSLAAGKHVLSEKPVAPDVKRGLELIKTYNTTYKEKGLVWRVAENFEAEPGYEAVRTAIQEGKIGKVIFFKAVVVNSIDKESKWYKTPWRTVPDYQGGFLLDGGVHTMAALRVMLPQTLTHLSGYASLNKEYLKPHDTINAVAKAGSHFHGTIELTFALPTTARPVADGIVITGSHGWVSVNQISLPGSNKPAIRVKIVSVVKEHDKEKDREEITEHPVMGIEAELLGFFSAVSGKSADAIGDPLGALRDVALIEAGLNSEGNPVDLLELVPEHL